MKTPASPAARALHAKLSALRERGIGGEALAAKDKLARLCERYDFTAPVLAPAEDIFAGAVYFQRGNSRALSVKFEDSDLANFVKWALTAGFNVEANIDTRAGIVVKVEASAESMPTLNHAAKIIRDSFARLWRDFSALPGATPQDARCFLAGLYDGMMNEERPAGAMLPQRGGKVKQAKGRKRTLAVAPGLSIHPYEVAVPLGRRIRVATPIGHIAADLKCAEAAARLAA